MSIASLYASQIEALKSVLAHLVSKQVVPTRFVAVLDIEGTTTALPFVTKVLFPYAEDALTSFVHELYPAATADNHEKNADAAVFRKALRMASAEVAGVPEYDDQAPTLSPSEFAELLRERMAQNSKVPYLKQVQGLIWRSGYANGSLKGHVFADAASFIQTFGRWTDIHTTRSQNSQLIGSSVEIYSSGSVAAQQLLFAHSTCGDLTPTIAGYHDPTTVGLKTIADSYRHLRTNVIAHASSEPAVLIFFTDSVAEVEACVASGSVDLCVFFRRPLNNPVTEEQEATLQKLSVPSIASFAQFESALKFVLDGSNDEEEANGLQTEASLLEQVKHFESVGDLKVF